MAALAVGPRVAYSLDRVPRMTKLERLIDQVRELPASERVRLIEAIEGEPTVGALRPASYESLLALAGKFHSDFKDVSTDKYRHVAEATAPRSGDE
jgi:hypothetical protein